MGTAVSGLSPLGTAPRVDGKSMAARPDSIEGRTIFLVDAGYDNSKDFIAELREWFGRNRPSVRIVDVHIDNVAEPAPEIYERIAREGDFAICAVGLCSMCAPAVTNHIARLEHEYHIPCVGVHDQAFSRLVASASRVAGMPNLRHVFLPSPVRGRTADEFARSIEGANMATGRPFTADLLSALTQPLSTDDATGLTYGEARPAVLEADTEEAMQELFHARGWTDTLPIVVPTPERVAAMLAGTSRRPDEIVGQIRATKTRPFWTVTVEQVAINAVMAGARPQELPTILAIFSSGYTARHSSTSSIGRMVVLNGPVRHEIGANSGIGALGPYSRTNSVIGRAYGLGSQNLQGGSEPGVTFAGSMGNPFALTNLTFAENEEGSPWEPLHVQYGYDAEQSTATIFGMVRSLALIPAGILPRWREHARSALCGLRAGAGATLLLDPLAAQDLVSREGFTDKASLREWMVQNGKITAQRWRDRPPPNRYESLAAEGIEPWASYVKAEPEELIPMNVLEDVHVVVVGGGTLPCWGLADGLTHKSEYNHLYGTTVSIDEWR